jgi:diacylglycerol kinase (ATP)
MPGKAVETLRFALRGFGLLFAATNIWFLTAGSVATAALALYLSVSPVEGCLLLLATASVWVAEALNTALERLTDLASPGFHPLAGQAKDIAAGAVLVAGTAWFAVAAIIFIPRLI